MNNILIASELIHYMKNKGCGKVGEIAQELDVSKEYDHIDWNFLGFTMRKMSFFMLWVN